MNMTLVEPAYLWLLFILPLFFLPLGGERRWVMVALRIFAFSMIVFALSRPVALQKTAAAVEVVVLDRSGSVSRDAQERALDVLAQLIANKDGAETRLLVLGSAPRTQLVSDFDQVVYMDPESSSLSNALKLALAAIPAQTAGGITLMSDGQSTDKDWGASIQAAQTRAIPIHALRLDRAPAPMQVVGIEFLDELRVGQVVRARIELAGPLQPAQLKLRLADRDLAQVVVDGASRFVTCDLELPQAGFMELVVRAGDEGPPYSRWLAVQDAFNVAYLGGRMAEAEKSLSDLLGGGFAIKTPVFGTESLDLSNYDAVVLDDRPAAQLSSAWQAEIARAVRDDGLGLLLSGGRSAFGPGGYENSPIAEISPVEFMQKEEKKDPSTTLAIIIDTSGSMVGNRMTIAKEIARLAMRRLEPHDKVGIVEFYGTKQWAAPIQSAANAIDLQRAINRLGAEGGTVLYPAVEEAYYALKNVETRFKHVLVLTDAGVETGPYESLLRRMSDDGITVSTVLVGPGRHSEFLVEMADWGGGRYYGAPDRFNLPELMLKKPNTSSLPAYRPGSVEVEALGSRSWWGHERPDVLPNLDGFVETKLREGAELLIQTRATKKPILASWHYGLGRVTALMTEPVGPGTAAWASWDDYGRNLGRVLSKTAAFRRSPFELKVERRGYRVTVLAERLTTGDERPRFHRVEEDANPGWREAEEIAPGLFRISFALRDQVTLRLEVECERVPGWKKRLLSDPKDARSSELQVPEQRQFLLEEAATLTGGQVFSLNESAQTWTRTGAARGFSATAIWPLALLLGLLAYLAELVFRRWARRSVET